MRLSRFVTLFIGLVLLAAITPSCKEEEFITTGKLEVNYTNVPSDLVAVISPAENLTIQISGELRPVSKGKVTYDLNPGNYVLKSWSSTTFFPDVGFQIRAGGTTTIYFDSNNSPRVD